MKKIILTISVLAMAAVSALAQDREIDLQRLDDFNKIELSRGRTHVETDLSFAFPMYFGWTTLTNINYKGTWAAGDYSSFLNFNTGRSFIYGLQLLDLNVHYGAMYLSAGLRWTFMDFTFKDNQTSIKPSGNSYVPYLIPIENPSYDYRKSKLHATYFGLPVRLGVNFGRATFYAGASIEYLVNGFAKYKHPKNKMQMKPLFNQIRATLEGGFSYGNLGVFVQYGMTPLFAQDLSDARTLTFGILLGL